MRVQEHAIAAAAAGVIAGTLVSPSAGALVFGGALFIDVDHYLWHAIRFRSLSLRRAYDFYRTKQADNHYCLCVLHTVEAMALYIACLRTEGTMLWIAVGCLVHMVLDVAHSAWTRGLTRRKWSVAMAVVLLLGGRIR